MPSDATQPARNRPVAGPSTAGGDADAVRSDEALIGYECALPWLVQAWLGNDAARPAWQGNALA